MACLPKFYFWQKQFAFGIFHGKLLNCNERVDNGNTTKGGILSGGILSVYRRVWSLFVSAPIDEKYRIIVGTLF